MSYTVIMHIFNEEEHLKHVLNAIKRQTITPKDILIVDDGSTDNTPKILEEYKIKYRWLAQSKDLPAYLRRSKAFDHVVKFADTETPCVEFLLKVDGDTLIADSYAERTIKMSDELGLSACSGITAANRKTRDLNNGAVLYRRCNLPDSKPMYAWDREIQLDLVRRGHKWKVNTNTFYSDMRPPTVKGSPGLKRVIINRVKTRLAMLQGFFNKKP